MELLTVQQAAERKRVSVKSIYDALGAGRLTRHEQYSLVNVPPVDTASLRRDRLADGEE